MDGERVFERLKAILEPYASAAVRLRDDPDSYALGSHEVRARDGYRTAFASVQLGAAYVAFHLMPVYVHPELIASISPALRGRMQGKSCFNFKAIDESLFEELEALVGLAARRFEQDGRLAAVPDR